MIDFSLGRGRASAPAHAVPSPDDPQVDTDARALVVEITDPVMTHLGQLPRAAGRDFVYRLRREDGRSCPLVQTVRLARLLARARAPIATVRRIGLWVDVQLALVIGDVPVSSCPSSIDRREARLQAIEDRFALERWTRRDRLGADELRAEAAACEGKASMLYERALWCRRRAREIETHSLSGAA